jgi:hypothetical protein
MSGLKKTVLNRFKIIVGNFSSVFCSRQDLKCQVWKKSVLNDPSPPKMATYGYTSCFSLEFLSTKTGSSSVKELNKQTTTPPKEVDESGVILF